MLHRTASRRGFASLWLTGIAGAGILGALSFAPWHAPAATTSENAAASTAKGSDHDAWDPNVCVEAFSKDLCEGVLHPGEVLFGECETPNGELCETLEGWGAEWTFDLRHAEGGCGVPGDPIAGRCDEALEKDGQLIANIDYTMRLHRPCPYRGCFTGTWEFHAEDGTVYRGQVMGTIGVGTHRNSQCSFGDRDCERCLDVEWNINQDPPHWRLGVEATFQGRNVTNPDDTRDEICFSLSGDFLAPSDDDGQIRPFDRWRFAGTADGTYVHCN